MLNRTYSAVKRTIGPASGIGMIGHEQQGQPGQAAADSLLGMRQARQQQPNALDPLAEQEKRKRLLAQQQQQGSFGAAYMALLGQNGNQF